MKQAFVIEHAGHALTYEDVRVALYRFNEQGKSRGGFIVTEITETEPERCVWKSWVDHDGDVIYSTSCKNEHKFFYGGPKENRYTTCPYCGKPIEVSE